mmetsp:Transcript_49631/g.120380  ORF Transcript_49631/g.120380 Transcript_49631/m.120380 type:complete len:313 (-) Transcript_49631:1233-2171(-)
MPSAAAVASSPPSRLALSSALTAASLTSAYASSRHADRHSIPALSPGTVSLSIASTAPLRSWGSGCAVAAQKRVSRVRSSPCMPAFHMLCTAARCTSTSGSLRTTSRRACIARVSPLNCALCITSPIAAAAARRVVGLELKHLLTSTSMTTRSASTPPFLPAVISEAISAASQWGMPCWTCVRSWCFLSETYDPLPNNARASVLRAACLVALDPSSRAAATISSTRSLPRLAACAIVRMALLRTCHAGSCRTLLITPQKFSSESSLLRHGLHSSGHHRDFIPQRWVGPSFLMSSDHDRRTSSAAHRTVHPGS